MKFRLAAILFLSLAIFGIGWFGHDYYQRRVTPNQSANIPSDKYLIFLEEVYDTIKQNYWNKQTDEELGTIFRLGIENLTGQPQAGQIKNKDDFKNMLKQSLKQIKQERKKEYVTQLADMVLANLKPFGRSRLYTQKEEKELSENVKNINSQINQYDVLGVDKTATHEEIKKAYHEKTEKLKNLKTPEALKEQTQIEKAYKILFDIQARQVYDQSGVEPTMDYKLLQSDILYIKLTKFSPTTLDELNQVTEKFDKENGPTSLVFDLRGNIGGSIDLLPFLLGPFIGADQYAYQFFHQDEKTDFKTRTGWLSSLVRYKKTIILIDQNTQSTAELFASVLKKYNVGLLIGSPTKGWGTIEKVFELNQQIDPTEKYSIFLVHSLALREDGQPIEGNKVQPTINVMDKNWEGQLYNYIHYPELILALKQLLN